MRSKEQKSFPRLPWLPLVMAWLVIAAASFALFARYPAKMNRVTGQIPGDFEVYVKARDRVWAGKNPYVSTESSPYKYPPGFLVATRILPENHQDAWTLFGITNLFLWAVALGVGARYSCWKSVLLLAVGIGISWKGLLETFDYGQMEFLILFLAVSSAAFYRKSRYVSGLLAGTLPWIKLPWIALASPFLITSSRQSYKRLAQWIAGYFSACFLWGAAIPSLAFGPERAMDLSQKWIQLLKSQPVALYLSPINQSLWSTLTRWTSSSLVALGLGFVLSAIFLANLLSHPVPSSAAGAEEEGGALAWVSPWLLLTQLLNPLSWRWGSLFLVGIPLASQRARWVESRALRVLLWLVAAVLFLLQQNPIVGFFGIAHWTDLHPYGIVTVYWVVLLVLTL